MTRLATVPALCIALASAGGGALAPVGAGR
jgi:hypothetical protein